MVNGLSKICFTVNYCLSRDKIKYWIKKQHQVNPVKETVGVKRCVFKVSKYIFTNSYHIKRSIQTLFEPQHNKTNKMTCAPRHSRSLIRIFPARMKKPYVLSYPLNAQWRLWSDWLKRTRGRAVSSSDFGPRGHGFESRWRQNSFRTSTAFIVQSRSCSPFHRSDMTDIPLKGT